MDTHLSYGVSCALGQICSSSYELEIETSRYRGVLPLNRIFLICHVESKIEKHYICYCTTYYAIQGQFHCLLIEKFGPVVKVFDYCDQSCIGLFLLEICRFRETLMRGRRSIESGRVQRGGPTQLDPTWTSEQQLSIEDLT